MIILDTNILSEVMKAFPEPVVARWMRLQRRQDLFTTSVCEAEIRHGIAILPDGKRKLGLEAIAQRVFTTFPGRILPFDRDAALNFAAIMSARREAGRPMYELDAQIAAIARAHGMSLATRDVQDFADTGVPLIDPWQP